MPLTKISYYKYRFIKILNFIGSENALLAAKKIAGLPDVATDGFHDAYLTAKLISICLTHISKATFNQFKQDTIRSNLLSALFHFSELEFKRKESFENIFAYCDQNPHENLEDSLESLIDEWEAEFDDENFLQLKTSCDSFIEFYEKNKSSLEENLANFSQSLVIEDRYKNSKIVGLQPTKILSLDEKSTIKNNGSILINGLRPCLGLIILAENDAKELSCLGYHHLPKKLSHEDLYLELLSFINKIKLAGYKNNMRLVLIGTNLLTLSLSLDLIMYFWKQNKEEFIANINIYLAPSPQNSPSYGFLNLEDNKCTIQAGFELYKYDNILSEIRANNFESSKSENNFEDSYFSSEESNSSSEEFDYNSEESESSSEEEPSNENLKEGLVLAKKRDWMKFYSSIERNDSDEEEFGIKKNKTI